MSRSTRGAFTLVEVLIVVLIIGVLIAMLLPATRRVPEAAARMACSNNLKQQIIAFHIYYDTFGQPPPPGGKAADAPDNGRFPTGCFGHGAVPDERLSWAVTLLPYLEQDALYKQFDRDKGFAGNPVPAQQALKVFLCPTGNVTAGDPITHYVALSGVGYDAAARPAGAHDIGFMGYDRVTTWAAFKDGTSNTIALMETRAALGPWARGGPSTLRGFDPADAPPVGDHRPFGGHNKTAQAAMADGSVRGISDKVAPHVLAATITVAGGETFNLD